VNAIREERLVADVKIVDGNLIINLSLLDKLLAFHGSFRIPLSHVTNAYVSDFEELELQYKPGVAGVNWGFAKTAGIFANPAGLIFVDITGRRDCLVVETRGERFPRIAVQVPSGEDPSALAHEIMRTLPDSGPVE